MEQKSISNNKGFSLIEIMAVLFILGLTIMIATPMYTRSQEYWLMNNAAQQLAGEIRLAQQAATSTGKVSRMRFYPDSNMYLIDLNVRREWIRVEGLDFRTTYSPELSFNNKGTPSMGGRVVFTNKFEQRKYVIITPVTGRVRIDDKPPDT